MALEIFGSYQPEKLDCELRFLFAQAAPHEKVGEVVERQQAHERQPRVPDDIRSCRALLQYEVIPSGHVVIVWILKIVLDTKLPNPGCRCLGLAKQA